MGQEAAGSVVVEVGANLSAFEAALAKARQMADLFDQQVSKKLSGNSATDAAIAKIAAAVDQTNALLAKMTGIAVTSSGAMTKLSGESEKASGSISTVGTSSATASASVGKLAAETNAATANIQRAIAANQQYAASNLQMANGGAARNEDIQAYGAALDDIRAKYNPLFKVTRDYLVVKEEIRLANKLGAISEVEAAAAVSRERQETLAAIGVLKGHTGALGAHGAALGLGTTQTMALMHATRSFTEQLLLGVSPLQALTAQMNHLSYAASGPGGFGTIFSTVGSAISTATSKIASFVANSPLVRGFALALGGVVTGFMDIKDAAEQAEHRSVGFGETFSAIFQTLGHDLGSSSVGSAFDAIWEAGKYAFDKLKSAATDLAEWTINDFRAVGSDMAFIWGNLPTIVEAAAVGAANALVSKMEEAVNRVGDAVNSLSDTFGGILPKIEHVDLGRFANPAAFDLAAKNAEHLKDVMAILNSTPLRDFGKDVVDQIQTSHALEGLNDLKNINFGSATSSANGLSSAIGGIGKSANGVTVEFGGMQQQVINVSRAFQDAKLSQLGELQQTVTTLHSTQAEIKKITDELQAAPHAAIADVFGQGFFGNASAAKDAIDRTVMSIDKLFNAYDHGNGTIRTVNDSLDMLRQTLLAQGGDPVAINAFFDSIVSGEIKVRQLNSTVNTLHDSILALPNKTVTITVRTQQVGSGTQSIYDVGGGNSVGVTRYGGVAGQQSGPSITANTVPNIGGYGSQGGTGNLGSSTVNVIRFGGARAAGGPMGANTPYWVGEHGPELVVPSSAGTVIPNGQSTVLANPQSAFTGQVATRDQDRMWALQMNIEANTRKTAQLLDEIKTTSLASTSGLSSGSSSGSISATGYDSNGLNAAGHTAEQVAAFNRVLASAQANYSAIGGMGLVGYGSNGLAATPQQIAYSIVYGGKSPVGMPSGGSSIGAAPTALHGGDPYNSWLNGISPSSPAYAARYAQALAASNKAAGFDTGGMIGGGPGDTQHVEFFKSPGEKVIIARPDQFADVRPGTSSTTTSAGGDMRPLQQTNHFHFAAGANVSKDSLAAMRTQLAAAVRDGLRSVNGR